MVIEDIYQPLKAVAGYYIPPQSIAMLTTPGTANLFRPSSFSFGYLNSNIVCFISTNNYKNKAIQRRGAEANGALALQPVEAPDPVCQPMAKNRKK